MSGPEFFRTRMGHKFFEHDVPKLASELGRLADNVAALNETMGQWMAARERAAGPKRLTIMAVDDQEQILRGIQRGLKQEHDVLLAATPEGALELLELHEVDAVLTDNDLGVEHDGLWLLEKVHSQWPHVRRLLMSGRAIPDLGQHIASGVVEQFVHKPVSTADLIALFRGGAR